MKDELTIIEHDLFGISDRLKGIDSNYFVCYNSSKHRFELHNSFQRGSTLSLVVPYESLDVRTVDYALRTRAERAEQLLAQMELENKRLEKVALDKQLKRAEITFEKALSG